jgi:ribosomal protein L37E
MTTTEIIKDRKLNVSDRCDRCGAQAFVIVKMVAGELYFCGHHFNKHNQALNKVSFEIIDERDIINARSLSSN